MQRTTPPWRVAVKGLRPGIERALRKDIDAFFFAARTIEFLSPSSRRLRPMDCPRGQTGAADGTPLKIWRGL